MAPERRHDSGFSVIEVAVAVLLMGVVSAALLNFLMSAMTTTTRASQHVRAEQEMTIALRTLTQDIRSASKVEACTTADLRTCLKVEIPRQASVGATCPARVVTYRLDAGRVLHSEVVNPATCAAGTTKFTDRVVLDKVVNGGTPLFTYFNESGGSVDPITGSIGTAASVRVSVVVDYGPADAKKISLSSTAALRNMRN